MKQKRYWLRGLLVGLILSLLYIPFGIFYERAQECDLHGLCGVWIFGFPFISVPLIILSIVVAWIYGRIKDRNKLVRQ